MGSDRHQEGLGDPREHVDAPLTHAVQTNGLDELLDVRHGKHAVVFFQRVRERRVQVRLVGEQVNAPQLVGLVGVEADLLVHEGDSAAGLGGCSF